MENRFTFFSLSCQASKVAEVFSKQTDWKRRKSFVTNSVYTKFMKETEKYESCSWKSMSQVIEILDLLVKESSKLSHGFLSFCSSLHDTSFRSKEWDTRGMTMMLQRDISRDSQTVSPSRLHTTSSSACKTECRVSWYWHQRRKFPFSLSWGRRTGREDNRDV